MRLANLRTALLGVALLGTLATAAAAQQDPPHSFTAAGDHFLLDGKPFQIISGEMHYTRIPRAYWRDRMRMAKAMGVNTIATYVFWNVHEPSPGKFDFSGNNDVAAFVRMAQEEGLHVLLRAGPYSCAEWEFGGFPAWLMADPRMNTALRSNDDAFMKPVEQWLLRLGQEVAPLQVGRGGPILAVQVENEYGNFGSDQAYMTHLRSIFQKAGFTDALLYTADPSRALPRGSMPGTYAAVNFGIGHAEGGLDALAALRPGQPLFASEYWPGWFDHWGHPHETRPIDPELKDLDTILHRGASVNIYMIHGGTSFGFMSGSSWTKDQFLPDVTSYDYDAPVDEAGHPTPKYFAYRKVIEEYLGKPLPPVPVPPPVIAVPEFPLTQVSSLWKDLPAPIASSDPQPMERFGQAYGFILYRTQVQGPKQGTLDIDGLNDYAQIYLDGHWIGTLDRRLGRHALPLDLQASTGRLDILVENSGRINSTRMMRQENKGIRNAVFFDGAPLKQWQVFPLPMESLAGLRFAKPSGSGNGPAFYRGRFRVKSIGDTFLDFHTLHKGAIWVNGHALGRYWNIGPQRTLYLPGCWLRKGWNEVVALDLTPPAEKSAPRLAGLSAPILNAPVADSAHAEQE